MICAVFELKLRKHILGTPETYSTYCYCNIRNAFTVTFAQFNATLLNKY